MLFHSVAKKLVEAGHEDLAKEVLALENTTYQQAQNFISVVFGTTLFRDIVEYIHKRFFKDSDLPNLSVAEEQAFYHSLFTNILPEVLDYIPKNYGPEQIFDSSDLQEWAEHKDYFQADDLKTGGYDPADFFDEKTLTKWATDNGFKKE